MPDFPIRKVAVLTEEIFHDGGPAAEGPRRRAAGMALVKNPYAGKFVEDIQGAMEDLKPLGLMLTDRLLAALGDIKAIDAYGKGAIVGSDGEIEHGATWHVPGGYAMRERLGQAKAIVPSAMKVGGFGSRLDVPLGPGETRTVTVAGLAAWAADTTRTLYRWDVRTPEEYAAGHLPGFGSAPGGQLVQETDVCAAVRGARIALADGGPASDGVRAAMTAHWGGWHQPWL